jgi:uncharacterized protein
VLVPRLEVCQTRREAMRGLLGRDRLPEGSGIWIPDCGSIHMFFMRFSIDAVFLGDDRTVRKIVAELRPWRMAWGWGAAHVLELPAGAAHRLGLQAGQTVEAVADRPL